jgi:hypothetical protein
MEVHYDFDEEKFWNTVENFIIYRVPISIEICGEKVAEIINVSSTKNNVDSVNMVTIIDDSFRTMIFIKDRVIRRSEYILMENVDQEIIDSPLDETMEYLSEIFPYENIFLKEPEPY